MKNNKIILGLVIVVCGAVAFVLSHRKSSDANIKLYGNVDIRQVNLSFRVGGKLQKLYFDEGDNVRAGDTVALLDNKPIENKLNQANAQKKLAQVQLNNATRFYNRNINLCKSGNLSRQDCDNILSKKEEAEANLAYVSSVVDEAQTSLDDTKLVAPNDGVILTRIQEEGSILGAGIPVYTLSLNDKMWVRAYIDGENLSNVKIGDNVKVFTDAGKVYDGKIGFVSPQAEFTPKNIETESLRTDLVYRIRINITNPDDFLKQGMPVSIEINKNND